MNIALILSGGTGTRLGTDLPKQYLKVNDKPVISYCLELFSAHKEIDGIQIVAEPSWQAQFRKCSCWASIMRRTVGCCRRRF